MRKKTGYTTRFHRIYHPENLAMAHFTIVPSIGYHPIAEEWMWCRQGPRRSHIVLEVETG